MWNGCLGSQNKLGSGKGLGKEWRRVYNCTKPPSSPDLLTLKALLFMRGKYPDPRYIMF